MTSMNMSLSLFMRQSPLIRTGLMTHPRLYLSWFGGLYNKSFSLTFSTTRTPGLIPRLQSAFCLFTTTQQAQTNPYAFVDRCLSPLVKLFHRLVIDVVGQTTGNSTQDSATLSRKSLDLTIR